MSRNEKTYLPITLDITGRKILVIGGGPDAAKKLKILLRFTRDVEVLAETVCDEIRETGVVCHEKPYTPAILDDYVLVYVCLNDPDMEQRIRRDGDERRVLVNVHDKPDLCRFVSPAIYRKDNISVSVGSDSKNVYEAIAIRDLIREFLEKNYFRN
ncbi:precorrin-2 dehydrogenase/sirohydrochlorin ferrochelatase family protein [Prolixibacter denitrificans]|jgi:precorrin-2 dehydrogenase/sirohydrochlorin ferrochelatase|uniref:precorrin-2 dehydrogenase n=1 Tax=Prolixibacter denitrificans TaxID=1541063 RepID=A0A2P8C7J8_9BACT|nr:bifunctional precorrin-2 dehydrogenase/sirohydrochlorin ferrochelatase [Prolixibacter denitrificans]PSK80935.1 precorrin-2 dehydrogenase/sirohydrochlorin ferrochelatase [Prolixibacter denitrificans]GET22337.1 siroheme synthase [Prolixibacter denitrificans]